MNVWTMTRWKQHLKTDANTIRSGLRLRIDANVDPEVRRACIDFAKWLRSTYEFPMRIPVYVKSSERIKAMDGTMVCGTFFGPYSLDVEPYARISTGDYDDLCNKWGKDLALASYLESMAHELTHYYQWINKLELEECEEERQARRCASKIIRDYATIREHP